MTEKDQSKIAFIWESRSLTGGQRRFLSIARALNTRGKSAIILLNEKDAKALRKISGERLPEIVTYRRPWWVSIWRKPRGPSARLWGILGLENLYFLAARRFWRDLLARNNVGMCHVSMSNSLARVVSGPALFEVTSPDWVDRLASEPDIVPPEMLLHAVSESVHRRLENRLPNRRVMLAPLPFPNMDPENSPLPDMAAKENLIVFAHRLLPRKNGVVFARVVHRFLADHPDWRVTIRGEGPDEGQIRQILNAEISSGQVELGFLTDLRSELYRARVFVSIIQPDNYPSQSVMEAMVCGTALLLSDQGRTREKFFAGNGRMTEVSEDMILSNLVKLTKDVQSLELMGFRSRQLAEQIFSQTAYLTHLEHIYAKLGYPA